MRQEKEGCRNLNENRKTEKQTNKKTFPLQTIYDAWLQYYTFTRPSNSPKKGLREKLATYLNANTSNDKGIKFGEYLR